MTDLCLEENAPTTLPQETARYFRGVVKEQAMAEKQRDNWRAKVDVGNMDYIPPEKEAQFRGQTGWTPTEGGFRDYFPPSEADLAALPESEREVQITPEQERYGLAHKKGDPIPKKDEDPLWTTKPTITTGG